jgi:group II intron reverse transcriptase/maturase
MTPTIEILERVSRNSQKNKDEVFTRLYRYMLRPDIYYVAYKNLYANNGASTKGVNEDTADGFSEEKIMKIINMLQNESYMPSPSRRMYVNKTNGKKRPLGIPTFTDKLVQEVLRMILQAVYEPVFLDCSHGFRPNKSCHTALKSITKGFNGIRWFVEGDIKGCFDNINHAKLVEIIGRKIKDARLIKLIWKFLKAGYMEDWKYNATYSGTPQGGIVSPIFANIYLHELDKFVDELAKDFNHKGKNYASKEYEAVRYQMRKLDPLIESAEGTKRELLIKQKRAIRAKLLKIPYKAQIDKKIKYVRYADDFLIGVNGNKEDCQTIKQKLSEFISNELKMELSEEKTLITHSSDYARFLGYDVRIRRNNDVRKAGNTTQRTLSQTAELAIPLSDKIMKFLFDKKIIVQTKDGKVKPWARLSLTRCSDLEIITAYNAELRGICNYYSLASNFGKLNYFDYLMEYSCLKTLACKHKTTIAKIIRRNKDGKGKWRIEYQNKKGKCYCYFADFSECKESRYFTDTFDTTAIRHSRTKTVFEQRLAAKVCELCGSTDAEHYDIHHVHKVKDLKGKAFWEQVMIAKRRKTIVVCEECHKKIHSKRVSNTK